MTLLNCIGWYWILSDGIEWSKLGNKMGKKKGTGPLRQATGPPRSDAGLGVGMLMVSWFLFLSLLVFGCWLNGFIVLWFIVLWLYHLWFYGCMVLWCYGVMVLWFCDFRVLWLYGGMFSKRCHFSISCFPPIQDFFLLHGSSELDGVRLFRNRQNTIYRLSFFT